MSRTLELSLAVILGAVLIILQVVHYLQRPPDFAAIEDIAERKQAFFEYLRPKVEAVNAQRTSERDQLQGIHAKIREGKEVSHLERRKLRSWAMRYDIEYDPDELPAVTEALLTHLDEIPVSMVLAQAAMESAWGTSRFVTQGNNFFGQWCYTKGCGMVPGARNDGARHEVKIFDSTDDAIYAYFRNINSHRAYRSVRAIRARTRQKGESLSGLIMVGGLKKYSQRGEAYIEELRSVIRFNGLE